MPQKGKLYENDETSVHSVFGGHAIDSLDSWRTRNDTERTIRDVKGQVEEEYSGTAMIVLDRTVFEMHSYIRVGGGNGVVGQAWVGQARCLVFNGIREALVDDVCYNHG